MKKIAIGALMVYAAMSQFSDTLAIRSKFIRSKQSIFS